jgi:ribosomal protein S18 acetylase RimI-like enzyme
MALEMRIVGPKWERSLASFFSALRGPTESCFHPHPFTDEYAKSLARYGGRDLYYLLVDGETILAYGMLRGWDEGYETPSLGIAVRPENQGQGLGELMMHFLHNAARRMGSREIRLKVYKENASAQNLYRRLGYQFEQKEEKGQIVGRLKL